MGLSARGEAAAGPSQADIYFLFGKPICRDLFRVLAKGPDSVTALAKKVKKSQSATSKALRLMHEHDLVVIDQNKNLHVHKLSERITLEDREHDKKHMRILVREGALEILEIPLSFILAEQDGVPLPTPSL